MLYSKTMITSEAKHNISSFSSMFIHEEGGALKPPSQIPTTLCISVCSECQKKKRDFSNLLCGMYIDKSFGTEYKTSCSRSVHNIQCKTPSIRMSFVVVYKLARLYRSRKKDLGIAQQTRATQVRKTRSGRFKRALPAQVPLWP